MNEATIDTLNKEVSSAKNNTEFELKYEEILKQFEDVKIKLENSESNYENLKKNYHP